MGEDGIEGLARKLTSGIQTSTQEEIAILDAELEFFVKKLGGTKHFSLSVLRKSDAYKRLMKHRLGSVEPFKHGLQKDFIVLFKRLINTEPCMERPLRATEESITFFNQLSARLESLQDLFSEQIGITAIAFEIIALTIAVSGIAIAVLIAISQIIPSIVLFFIMLTIVSVESFYLSRFSHGPMIDDEVTALKHDCQISGNNENDAENASS